MTSILLLGNSHAACLREAWRADPSRWAGTDLRILAAKAEYLLETRIEGGVLRPSTEEAAAVIRRLNGVDELDLRGIEAVAVVGCHMAPVLAARIWAEMRWPALPSVATDAGDLPDIVSRATACAAHRAQVEDALALRILRHVAGARALRHVVASQPRPTEAVMTRSGRRGQAAATVVAAGDGEALSAMHEEVAAQVVEAAGAIYVPQPAATSIHGMLTQRRFMDGAFRLSGRAGVAQPEDDVAHANGLYGALMLDAIVAAVG